MRGFGRPEAVAKSLAFDRWLRQVVTAAPAARTQGLTQWLAAPHARWVHPREEHLLPLMVAVGAAGEDLASAAFSGTFMGVHLSAFHFPAT
jgi:aromatic ring-opening dioxygenase catalytic subunit (LigB family)